MKKGCDKISHLVSDAFDRKLSWIERIEVKIHLSMCSLCRSYANNIGVMHDIFSYIRHSDESGSTRLSQAAKHKIKQILKEECDDKS
ncbi:MAG: zf-HC2 domain-containing protein [Mariprofundaceae bacterium]|nr:zf-HC2 domain-containing protein [Mariprofundaceae bacterium]